MTTMLNDDELVSLLHIGQRMRCYTLPLALATTEQMRDYVNF